MWGRLIGHLLGLHRYCEGNRPPRRLSGAFTTPRADLPVNRKRGALRTRAGIPRIDVNRHEL